MINRWDYNKVQRLYVCLRKRQNVRITTALIECKFYYSLLENYQTEDRHYYNIKKNLSFISY